MIIALYNVLRFHFISGRNNFKLEIAQTSIMALNTLVIWNYKDVRNDNLAVVNYKDFRNGPIPVMNYKDFCKGTVTIRNYFEDFRKFGTLAVTNI